MTDLIGKRAMVTGASSGIGAAFAQRLASKGCDLFLVGRRLPELNRLATDLRGRFGVDTHVIGADLATTEGVDTVVDGLPGRMDWLVNGAGFGVPGPFHRVPLEQSLALIDVHVLAAVRLTRAVLPAMVGAGRGRIVNVASIGAFLPRAGDATYCASKSFLVTFSRALHFELRDSDVRVQALCPGFTRTDFYRRPNYAGLPIEQVIPGWLWSTPQTVVDASMAASARNRPICVPGIPNRLLVAAGRLGLTSLLLRRLDARLPPPHRTTPPVRPGVD